MSKRINQRRAAEEARLRHQLELQSQQIERVFDHHRLLARVEGGQVNQQAVQFDLQTQLANGLERLRSVKQDLRTALGVSSVQFNRENGVWRLQVSRPEDPPVALLDLLNLVDGVPPATAVLGLAENGQPVLLNFLDPNTRHVLLAGGEKAGKTSLLRSMAVSLALHNRQAQLQLLVIDVDRQRTQHNSLEPLNYLPHLLQEVIQNGKMAEQALQFLCDEMEYRREQGAKHPTIVMLIDNVVTLLRLERQEVRSSILRLLQHGAEAGIHLVLGTRRPEARELNDLRKVDLPVRLVGRVHDAYEAQAAAEIPRSRAEYLLGEGDFLAILDRIPLHFQAAFASDYDVHLSLKRLFDNRAPRLLAQRFVARPALQPVRMQPNKQPFARRDDGRVAFDAQEQTIPPPPYSYEPTPLRSVLLIHEETADYAVEPEIANQDKPVVEDRNVTRVDPRAESQFSEPPSEQPDFIAEHKTSSPEIAGLPFPVEPQKQEAPVAELDLAQETEAFDNGQYEDVVEDVIAQPFAEVIDIPILTEAVVPQRPFFESSESEGDLLTASFFEAIVGEEDDDEGDLPFFEDVFSYDILPVSENQAEVSQEDDVELVDLEPSDELTDELAPLIVDVDEPKALEVADEDVQPSVPHPTAPVHKPIVSRLKSRETAVSPAPKPEKPRVSLGNKPRPASIPFLDDLDDDPPAERENDDSKKPVKADKTAEDALAFLDDLRPLKPKNRNRRPIARRRPLNSKGANE
ncbi:MAG: FtsK/SpoIIIE domain-containing protein [Chloroflexota bacterium]